MKFARLITLCCSVMATAQIATAGQTIQITSGEYPPWTSADLKHKGFTNHVISEGFKLEGYSVEFTFYPWKRAFEAAKAGHDYHATSYWYRSPERERFFFYSEPIQIDEYVFFYRKDKPLETWETLDDLKGKRIGATRGYTYTQEFWDAQETGRLDIETANSEELNIKKLWKGRIDLFPTGPLVGKMMVRELFGAEGLEKVSFHPKPLLSVTGHLLISKRHENARELLEAFNRGLARLKESGRYTQMQEDLVAGKYSQ